MKLIQRNSVWLWARVLSGLTVFWLVGCVANEASHQEATSFESNEQTTNPTNSLPVDEVVLRSYRRTAQYQCPSVNGCSTGADWYFGIAKLAEKDFPGRYELSHSGGMARQMIFKAKQPSPDQVAFSAEYNVYSHVETLTNALVQKGLRADFATWEAKTLPEFLVARNGPTSEVALRFNSVIAQAAKFGCKKIP